jgi:hypothetical protein
MSGGRFDELERFTPLFDAPEPSFERFLQRRDRKRRHRRIATGVTGVAVSAAIVATLAMVLPQGGGPAGPEPDATIGMSVTTGATTTSSTTPAGQSPVDVATGFVEAYGDRDADRAISYLGTDWIGGGWLGDLGRTEEEFRQVLSLGEAQRGQQLLRPCVEVDRVGNDVIVQCPFESNGFGSEQLGLGPYGDHYWDLTVRDGSIVRSRIEWNIDDFIAELVRPFGTWVMANYPDDVPAMYINEDPTDWRISDDQSLQLWEQHVDEWVKEWTAKLEVGEAFIDTWVTGDGDAVAAILADGTWEDFEAEMLPRLHDWYRAVGWEYQSEGCAAQTVMGTVGCAYTFENELTRFFGADPVTRSFQLSIVDGEIARVRDGYNPRLDDAWQRFLRWVERHHPHDVQRMYTADTGFARWDTNSIALWERYLDEFVASVEGYSARAESICTAAHARLNDEVEAAGIDLVASPDDGSGLQLIPSNEVDVQAYEEAARRIQVEAVAALRAVAPPESVEENYAHAYDVLDRLAEGGAQVLNTDAAEFRSQVESLGLGLDHCTFS